MKNYINPEMKIAMFDRENVVTESATDPSTAIKNEVGGQTVSASNIKTENNLSLFD